MAEDLTFADIRIYLNGLMKRTVDGGSRIPPRTDFLPAHPAAAKLMLQLIARIVDEFEIVPENMGDRWRFTQPVPLILFPDGNKRPRRVLDFFDWGEDPEVNLDVLLMIHRDGDGKVERKPGFSRVTILKAEVPNHKGIEVALAYLRGVDLWDTVGSPVCSPDRHR